ncbi:ribbon-helix-helix protein, CopG family [Cryobacterium arcticum]|nr:ribbon-helix-helix protein, CopG family [Cryobacterium arcticum]
MPNKPKTPLRSIRISDELWEAAQQNAAAEGRTVSEVVREALERYNARRSATNRATKAQ